MIDRTTVARRAVVKGLAAILPAGLVGGVHAAHASTSTTEGVMNIAMKPADVESTQKEGAFVQSTGKERGPKENFYRHQLRRAQLLYNMINNHELWVRFKGLEDSKGYSYSYIGKDNPEFCAGCETGIARHFCTTFEEQEVKVGFFNRLAAATSTDPKDLDDLGDMPLSELGNIALRRGESLDYLSDAVEGLTRGGYRLWADAYTRPRRPEHVEDQIG